LDIVLAAKDPGRGNFVETAGFTEGIMLLRLTFPRSVPTVSCLLTKGES
jgi:hypothetical protein